MKKILFLSALILSFFAGFQGNSRAITVMATPSPATVNQNVTITVNSSYSVIVAAPNCTLAVDFGDGSPWAILTACTTNSCTRTVSHTYTTPGNYTITAQSLPDACISPPVAPDPATINLTVRCTPLSFTSPATLPSGSLSANYSYQIQATGGQTPYNFSIISGVLPPGLGMNSSGLIAGTPSEAGTFNFMARVRDSCPTGTQTQNQSFSITIACPQMIITSPTVLPPGTTGQAFTYQLETAGGVPPFNFTLTSGPLPPGLSLTPSGLISGTLTALGTYNFVITATDSCAVQPQVTRKSFSMTSNAALCPPLSITSPAALPSGTASQPYSQQILITGGQAPISFSLVSGSLPQGLSLNASGLISGTPKASGSFSFMVKIDDSCLAGIQTQRQSFAIMIGCPTLKITSSSVLPSGTAGQGYSRQILTSGGQAPISFSLVSGSLPQGLSLSASGLISGSPKAAGVYNFSIIAADSCALNIQQAQQSFSMVVSGDLRVAASPASFKIPRNMASTQNLVYSFSNTSTSGMTLTSARGVFTANGQTIGENLAPLTVALTNGSGALSEVVNVPVAITLRAEEAGTSRIIYTRTFTDGAMRATAQVELIAGTEAAAKFAINRLQIYFENRRGEITVNRNQPGIKAFADIRFTGSGLLTGYWEADGRILEYVNQHLVYGKTVTLTTPNVPPLPTFSPGTHTVRLVVTAPAIDIPIPQALYFVTSEEARALRVIDLKFPEDQSSLSYEPIVFEWEINKKSDSYSIVFFDDTNEKPIFSAYTKENIYQVPPSIFSRLFARDKTYHWQVKEYDTDGNILGESTVYGFVFSK